MKTSNQILYFKLKKNNNFFNNFSDLVSVSREFIIDQDSYSWMVLPLILLLVLCVVLSSYFICYCFSDYCSYWFIYLHLSS